MAEDNNKLHIRLHVYDTELPVRRKSDKELLYMALIDIALRYVKNKDRNDTTPYDDILAKITSELEEALGEKK